VEAELTDNYIQVPPNSSGLKVDTSELTVNGQTVERQRIVIADPTQAGNLVGVSSDGNLAVHVADQNEYFALILGQLKRIAALLEILADTHIPLNDTF
jgi:hypothetical protein